MDIGSISVALSSLKAARDISQAMLELKSTADIQLKVIELQGQILTAQNSALNAQSEQYELKKKLSEAEAELVRLLQWETEKQRYSLLEISPGVFSYGLKEESRGTEPGHWLCANCFNKGAKSILQFTSETSTGKLKRYKCHNCNSEIMIANANWSPPPSSPRRGGPQGWMAR